MIKIDLLTAVSLYLILSTCLVFIFWIFYNYRNNSLVTESEDLAQCPFCTYLFVKYQKDNLQICPRCKSYINVQKND